jgi:hypothetical protein
VLEVKGRQVLAQRIFVPASQGLFLLSLLFTLADPDETFLSPKRQRSCSSFGRAIGWKEQEFHEKWKTCEGGASLADPFLDR